jgi:methionine-rich copper-binding protein CopC
VATPPTELRFWFSEAVPLNLTRIALRRGTDTLRTGALSQTRETKAPIIAKIVDPVPPGAYTVDWRTMGKDGHVVKGSFGFSVRAAAEPANR